MGKRSGRIEVEGLKELNRAVRRSVDTDLPKRIGQANKEIGRLVIDRLNPRPDPAAVGQGGGAAVRPSATKREVLLRVGGKHREGNSPQMQWGKRPGRNPRDPAPPRPYILRTAQDNFDEISDAYMTAIEQALKPAFADTEF